MPKTDIKAKKGFTIIEVILVLAIGSLIILMALVALPSLQASQRDTQRKNDYAMLETAITNYASNNRGKLPDAKTYISDDAGKKISGQNVGTGFLATYIKDNWTDPSKGSYTVEVKQLSAALTKPTLQAGEVKVYISARCDGETPTYDAKLGSRRFAIYGFLESGAYCQSN